MGSRFRRRTGIAVGFALLVAGIVAPSALATTPLTVSKTATAHWTQKYDWTIDKTVSKSTIEMKKGESSTVRYTVALTKSAGAESMWVDGEICVTNDGAVATENLVVVDRLRVFLPGGSQTLVSSTIDTSANPVLDPGESYCYPYSFPFGPFPNATSYANEARVTITNDPREPGVPLGPSAEAPFSVPAAPVATNDSVHVDDTNGMSWVFSASGSQSYYKTFTCRDEGTRVNTAKIRETGQSDSATVVVKCKDKPKDDDCKKGKDKDNDHWGWGGRGDDDHRGWGDRGDRCDDDDDDHGHHYGDHDDDNDHGDHHDRCDGWFRDWWH